MAKHTRKKTSTIHSPTKTSTRQKLQKTFSHPAWKKYLFNEKILILILILIPILVSSHYRMQSSDLDVTEQWAWDTYRNNIRGQVAAQISAQYPNLPQAQRDLFINQQLDEIIEQQRDQIEPQIQQSAEFFKSRLQDENGNTYLLAIDPYLWLTQAENYVENGHMGDSLDEEGVANLDRRNGRETNPTRFNVHAWLGAKIYQVVSVFDSSFTVQRSMFLLPVIIIALAIIPAFFIGRKIGGNLAGFVAGLLIALNTSLLSRTPAGFSDTDGYIIFFPLLIVWTFIEAIDAKKNLPRYSWLLAASISIVLFSFTWGFWWHIAGIILAVAFIHFLQQVYKERKQIQKISTKSLWKLNSIHTVLIVVVFLVSLTLFSYVLLTQSNSPITENAFMQPLRNIFVSPLNILAIKSVASADVWPNVLTTVAELNAGSWGQIINSLGGQLFFILGILGVILTIFIKNKEGNFEVRYLALLTIWFIGLSFASVMSSRFIAILAAPFAVAFGSAFGIIFRYVSKVSKKHLSIPKIIPQILIIVILGFLLADSFTQAEVVSQREIPSMTDAWYDSLKTITADGEDGIITSWWDFGHWFVNIAERRVTFDGGGQGRRIYWVGKSLMTPDAQENKDILRMLNCGQEDGLQRILEFQPDSYEAATLITTITHQSREEAAETLEEGGIPAEQLDYILEKTHCGDDELLPQYYIVSQDMIGKAAVWAHFGSWNFTRAKIYNVAANTEYTQAITEIQELGFSAEEAEQLYFQAISLTTPQQVDAWVSPWPSYVTASPRGCTVGADEITCPVRQALGTQQGQQIVLDTVSIDPENPEQSTVMISLVQGNTIVGTENITPRITSFDTGEEIITTTIEGQTNFPYEVLFMENEGQYQVMIADPLLARSMFSKLFFFEGKYANGYEKLSDQTTFTGQRIIVYKVDLVN